ncbi:MAG: hypothetical protein B7Y99_13355 [Caulobacterales bacterium 32-69-10]|nr:MAG: hypothetical protein B7Y99_13355 [Caulobacterales bacterium 32-69-10]
MLHNFLVWLQELGRSADGVTPSWSEALQSAPNFWGLLEATHVLSLMLFAGTIFVVDLRLLGVAFRRTPVSVLSDRVLPLTVAGFAIIVVTGLALFFSKPVPYYHNFWFRAKMVFILIALINIVLFHYRVQRNIGAWNALAKPPAAARASAAVSLTAWLCVIFLGRFIAFEWLECGKPIPHWINVVQECSVTDYGAVDLKAVAQ